jgi:hypothetical protein
MDNLGSLLRFNAEYSDWPEIIPLDTFETFGPSESPPFPFDSLPKVLGEFGAALAESTQTPPEMVGLLLLGVLATAFQGRHVVQVTADWIEPLCLFLVAILPSGERKTAVTGAVTRPLFEFEAEQRSFEAEELAENQAKRRLLEKTQLELERKAAAGKGSREEVYRHARELSSFKEMFPFRLLVDDVTPEKLASLMAEQGGEMTIASAEGGVFDALRGRYDSRCNLDIYLKGHAGDPFRSDRLGRKSDEMQHPRLTMMLSAQPAVLRGLMANQTFKGRGLCGRFLFAVCRSKVGFRNVNPPPIPAKIKQDYWAFVYRILAERDERVLFLSPEADKMRISYQDVVERRLANEWDYLTDWGGKLTGAVLRIAGLLHAAQDTGPFNDTCQISEDTLVKAISIGEFLGRHAEKAYQSMGADIGVENAVHLLRRILSCDIEAISKRDLFQLCRNKSWCRTVDSMEAPLAILEDYGYLRRENQSTGGRPTQIIELSPRAKLSKPSKPYGLV